MVSLGEGEVALGFSVPEQLIPKFQVLCVLSRKTQQEAVIDWVRNPEGLGSSEAYRQENGDVQSSIAVPRKVREDFKAACNALNRSMKGEIVAMMQRKVDAFEMIYPQLVEPGNWV